MGNCDHCNAIPVLVGRCVKEERFDIGCSLDVLPEMDHLCSGRQKCEVKVDDSSFKRTTPCSVDLKIHLWTSYDCVKGQSV